MALDVKDPVPVEVVQTREPVDQLAGVPADGPRLVQHGPHRHVAQAHDFIPVAVPHHRLGDHSAGIGKVDQPGVGAELFHVLHNAQDHRDGAEGFEHAAGAVGLLAQHPIREGDPLVLDPGVQKAHPELGGDKVRPGQSLPAVQGHMDLDLIGGGIPHPLGHGPHDLHLLAAFLHVHQPHLPDGQAVVPLDETLHQLGGVAAAAADGDNLDRFFLHG